MADRKTLLDGDVENLISEISVISVNSAFSAFSVTVVGQATLTTDYDAVLAANWHRCRLLFVSASPLA